MYWRILHGNPRNDASLYHYNCLLSIIIPPVTKCVHDAKEKKENAKRVWSAKLSQGKTERIYTFYIK